MAAPQDEPVSALDARIARTVETVRSIWAFIFVVSVAAVLFTGNYLWFFFLMPLAALGYMVSLLLCGMYIGGTTTKEELEELREGMEQEAIRNFNQMAQEPLDAENTDHQAAAQAVGITLGTVVEISDVVVARYYDYQIPEWIDIRTGEKTERFFFDSVAMPSREGNGFVLPDEEGTTLFNGGIFKRGQPAQSD